MGRGGAPSKTKVTLIKTSQIQVPQNKQTNKQISQWSQIATFLN